MPRADVLFEMNSIVGLFGVVLGVSACAHEEAHGVPAEPEPEPAQAPASPRVRVTALLDDAIEHFCSSDGRTAERVLAHYAPNGATQAGGVKLPEGTPFVIRNMGVTSLRLFEPFDFVVWWFDPKSTGSITELNVDLGGSARIVVYDDYVKARGLGTGRALEQGHPLGDIPHEHVITCAGRRVIVVVNEIVWQGEAVGKIGKLTLSLATE